jgi:protein O-GlcNAc transferase
MPSTPPTIQQIFDLAVQHHQAGRLHDAQRLYLQVLTQQPQHADALHGLGIVAYQSGDIDPAESLIRRALAINPGFAEAHSSLGNLLAQKGRLDDAVSAYRRALAIKPHFPLAHYNLGLTLRQSGRLDDAIAAFRQAVEQKPDFLDALDNLGVTLKDQGRFDDSIAAFQRAIALRPGRAEGYYNLGIALNDKELFDEAIVAFRRAIELRPDFAECLANLGNALKDQGDLDGAIAAFRQACAIAPEKAYLDSNLVYTLHFHPGYEARSIAGELARWNRRHAEPLKKFIVPHGNSRDPDRRLRIGYVSPYFYEQAEAFFVVPLLEAHDHANFEIHCYSSVIRPDAVTVRHRDYADAWHEVLGRTDAELAEIIRRHQIDILIDLAMHMAFNRELTFARKPAPLQVAWLAYPGGTGMDAMDYRITDAFIDPPDADLSYRERSIRLPDCWCCYHPLSELAPAAPRATGPIQFGSLNNPCKLNDPILHLWARLMQGVPESNLLIQVVSESHRRKIRDLFQAHGIPSHRIEFAPRCGREEYLRLYDRIDICLDPLPYNGITTTCDALWMGVPVVTLAGKTAAGRAGFSILQNLGLPDLTATDPDQFVSMTANLAADRARLSELRANLRDRMRASPIMDAPKFARNIEAAYRQIWQNWCATQPS